MALQHYNTERYSPSTRLHLQKAHDFRVVHDVPDAVRGEHQELVMRIPSTRGTKGIDDEVSVKNSDAATNIEIRDPGECPSVFWFSRVRQITLSSWALVTGMQRSTHDR